MVDLKSGINPLFLRQDDLRQGIELLFYAYRDFTGEPDEILASYGFGRAHHRAIYFVGRNPDVTVSELLAILKITKQSLSRVLSGLVEQGFIEQNSDPADGRRRRLTLTEKGHRLESELSATQIRRIARAYRKAGAEAVQGFREVMLGIVNAEDRARAMKPHQPAGKSRDGAAQRNNQDPDAGPRVPDN